MSFTIEVLEEIVNMDDKSEASLLAEFIGVITTSGYVRLSHLGPELIIKTSRPVSARRIIRIARSLFSAEVGPLIFSENAFERWYEISLTGPKLFQKLSELNVFNNLSGLNLETIRELYKRKKEFANSFLRGVFMVSGYVQNPKKGRDLEITTSDERAKDILSYILKSEGFRVNSRYRKHKHYIYLKSYEDIKDFLRRIGAVNASFKFEDQQTINEMKNFVNRQVNFEKANVERSVTSAVRQIEAILFLERMVGINNLSPALREAAQLRLKYPNLSLEELARKTKAGLTKSGLRHRLLRIEKLAQELKEEKGG